MTMGYCRRFYTGDIPSTQTPGGKGVASIIVLLYLSGALPPRGGHVVTQCLYMSLHDLLVGGTSGKLHPTSYCIYGANASQNMSY